MGRSNLKAKDSVPMRKKVLSCAMALVLAVGLCPSSSYAADAELAAGEASSLPAEPIGLSAASTADIASGECGACVWVIDASGKLTISAANGGSGVLAPMQGFGTAPWYSHHSEITSAGFGKGVKAAESLAYLFAGLENLASVDLSGLNASDTESLYGMFKDCTSLSEVDLSGVDFSKAVYLSEMFSGCSSLSTVTLSGIDTSAAVYANSMFEGCSSLKSLDLTGLDTALVKSMNRMFASCSALASLDLSVIDTGSAENMYGMFLDCSSLRSVKLTGLNTSNVQDMIFMFSGCSSLERLDLTGLNTSSVTDMSSMFSGCSALTEINLTGLDTSSVTDMSSMFSGCSSLENLDLTGLDTSSVTDMSSMFYSCSSLSALDVSHFNTSKVTTMNAMFASCSALASLDLSAFDTAKVEDMAWMFNSCSSLTQANWQNLNTGNVWTMDSMFWGCPALAFVDLSHFDVSHVTVMSSMFFGCTALEQVLLPVVPQAAGSADDSNLDMEWMFFGCTSLKAVSVPESTVDLSTIGRGENVFAGCTSLKGGNGTAYDPEKAGVAYARVDGEGGQAGYFQVVALHEHAAGSENRENDAAATCLEDGSYDLVTRCTVCDGVLSSSHVVTPALDHDWGEGVETTPATCDEAGVMTYTCKRDSAHTRTEPIPALDHNWGEWEVAADAKCEVAGVERRVCSRDSSHTEEREIAALEHELTHVASNADCDHGGTAEHWVCSRCNKLFSDASGSHEITAAELAVSALGHDWGSGVVTKAATCDEAGVMTYTCMRDSTHTRTEPVAALGHSWGNWVVMKKATYDSEGQRQRSCTRCGHVESEAIAKLVRSVSDAAVSVGALTYRGTALSPSVIVTFSGTKLRAGTDYTVTYRNAQGAAVAPTGIVAAGTYTAVINGKGAYTGSVTKKFVVTAANLASGSFSGVSDQTFSGADRGAEPKPTVKFAGKTLKLGIDYTLSYANNKRAGSASVIVTGKGNFTGAKTISFQIKQAKIKSAKFSKIKAKKLKKKGRAVKPKPTVKFAGKKLKLGVDYTLSYKNNKKVGKAKVIVKGKGNFTGKKTIKFKIKR